MKKDIHIVFGRSAKGTLNSAMKNTIQLICLEDGLFIGPVCDVNSVEKIEKRFEWFSKTKIFGEIDYKSIIMSDIEVIKTFIETYDNEKIYLWTDYTAYSILNTTRLLYHLKVPCNNIFIIDFPNNITGNIIHKTGEVAPPYVNEVTKCYTQLTDEKLSKFVQLWEKIKSGNSILKILDENGQIIEKEENYFDDLLISYCTNTFQSAARMIYNIYVDDRDNPNFNDSYLNWRLKHLSLQNKIEIRGNVNDGLKYEVKNTTK